MNNNDKKRFEIEGKVYRIDQVWDANFADGAMISMVSALAVGQSMEGEFARTITRLPDEGSQPLTTGVEILEPLQDMG